MRTLFTIRPVHRGVESNGGALREAGYGVAMMCVVCGQAGGLVLEWIPMDWTEG